MQTVQAGEGMRVGGSRKAILPPELVSGSQQLHIASKMFGMLRNTAQKANPCWTKLQLQP